MLSTFSNIFSSETTGPIEAKFHMQLPWDGRTKVCSMVLVPWPRWPPCPYMVKTLKKSSSPEPKSRWPWILEHQVVKYYHVCSNDDHGLTLTYFTAMSNLFPYAFVWGKGKTMDFLETIVVCDIKVGRCSQQNEYMNLYEYQRSRSFTDLRQRSFTDLRQRSLTQIQHF